MGIQSKILFTVGIMILVVVLTSTLLISQRAQNLSTRLSLQVAEETAHHYGLEVQRLLEAALQDAKLLEASFWKLRAANVDRRVLDQILKQNTAMKADVLGSWMLWEPNAYDGKDDQYRNAEGHDDTGRVNSFWHWLGDDVVHEANVDWQTSSWYQNPKRRMKETLENPYFYEVSGENLLLISSIQPIVHDGRFHGVVGVDLKLNTIQSLVDSLRVLDSGYSTLIANNGMVVAHPNNEKIGKLFSDVSAEASLLNNINRNNFGDTNTITLQSDDDMLINAKVYHLLVKIDVANTETPWTLIVTLPVEKVVAPAVEIRNEIFFLGIAFGLVMLLLLTILVRHLLSPIVKMTRILDTEFDSKLGIFPKFNISSEDEIGQLALSFNQMSTEINHSRAQLEMLNIELSKFNEELEERVLRKTQKLLESEKMASLGRLVTGMAHELNTPVGVCVTALSFLQQRVLDENSSKEDIEQSLLILSENLNKVSAMVSSFKLLSVSTSEEDKIDFPCIEMIRSTAASIRSQYHANNIDVLILGKEIEISSYPNAISQALSHIISNAIIHAFPNRIDGKITIAIEKKETAIEIICSDNGIGMDETLSGHIFEAFSSKRLGSKGCGLGMNIVYNVITQTLNGTIECSSKIGEGTQYVIRFPL